MQCIDCGAIMVQVTKPLTTESLIVGEFVTSPLEVTFCSQCDCTLLGCNVAQEYGEQIREAEHKAIGALPVSKFIGARDAAEMVGMTFRDFNRNKRIQRGFIMHVDLGEAKIYYQPSVEQFRATGDGRMLIVEHNED